MNPNLLTLASVKEIPCLILLGEPGAGKTTELDTFRETVSEQLNEGTDLIHHVRLSSVQSDDYLFRQLFDHPTYRTWQGSNQTLHLFLDGFDECLIRLETLADMVGEQLSFATIERLRLRIACRSAEWPSVFEAALKNLWKDNTKVQAVELAPLGRNDVHSAAEARDERRDQRQGGNCFRRFILSSHRLRPIHSKRIRPG